MTSKPRNLKIFVLSLIVLVAAVIGAMAWANRLVIQPHDVDPMQYAYRKGEIVNPLNKLDFSDGSYFALIDFTNDDRNRLPKSVPNASVIKTDDVAVLNQLKQVDFIFTNSDTATVTSQLIICQNKRIVFEAGIVIENKSEGLQNRDFGWLEVKRRGELTNVLRSFHRVWVPVIYKHTD